MLKPNDLTIEQIDTLTDWELLVSIFHFAPTRKDCKEITIYPLMADWKEFARHKLKEIIKERVVKQEEVESGV
jgi:hypothetical protein